MGDANATVTRLKKVMPYEPKLDNLDPRFVVLKRTNGSYEPLGQVIGAFETAQEAEAEAAKLAEQHHGIRYTVFCNTYETWTSPKREEARP